ncbi:MAG: urea ABC transporter permease subunit UrtC, partial [SAR324 cluster bacterium]|nr:urea ABC transporter permease subunit UrtC [SAR324 cluster bacterium]
MLVLHSKKGWSVMVLLMLIGVVVIPVLNLMVPVESGFHVPDYLIPLLGKFLCFAIVALAMDMVWGYTGILSLGHGVFFALGGYAMGMHLMRAMAGEGVYRSELPDFMVFLNWKELPWYWYGFSSFPFAMFMVMFV